MHSARPCLWWAYCCNIAGLRICPLHWVLGQIYLPFTHSSGHILFSPFLIHILTHMESALKAPVNFWSRLCFTTPSSLEEALAHSHVVTRSAWMAHPDLVPPGDVAISWSPHSPFWILFAFHSLFTFFVFSTWERNADFQVELEHLLLKLMRLSREKGFHLPFRLLFWVSRQFCV